MTLSEEPKRLTLPVSRRDHRQGNPAAPITLVQYGDYQCPDCAAVRPTLQLIQQQLGDRLQFVFRHFPQGSLHPQAYHAAEAAEAAAAQHRFWDMHHHLLNHQAQLADSDLVMYAIALHLNVDQFLHEMTTDCHVARVQADIDSAIHSGVVKTPTFFINDEKFRDDWGINQLLEVVIGTHQAQVNPSDQGDQSSGGF